MYNPHIGATGPSLVTYPWFQRLKMDSRKINKIMGRVLARKIRARMRRGQDSDGALPNTKREGRPFLNDTGKLIKSIKYKNGEVAPTGTRRDDHKWTKRVQNRNAAILAVQVFERDDIDPLEPSEFDQVVADAAEREIAKQIDRGEFQILGELRTQKGRRRR